MNTHRLLSAANFLLYEVLRVSPPFKGSTAKRYLGAWMVFFVSGIFHIGLDVSAGK